MDASRPEIIKWTKAMQERERLPDDQELETLRSERTALIGAIRSMYQPDKFPGLYNPLFIGPAEWTWKLVEVEP